MRQQTGFMIAALVVISLVIPAGRASAHGYTCWTAGPGYTIYCGPKFHQHDASWPAFSAFSLNTTVRIGQTQYGSFQWYELRVSDGVEQSGVNFMGDTYVFQYNNPGVTTIFYSRSWFCQRVYSMTYSALVGFPLANNATTVGYWHQYAAADECYSPGTIYVDSMDVYAY